MGVFICFNCGVCERGVSEDCRIGMSNMVVVIWELIYLTQPSRNIHYYYIKDNLKRKAVHT